MKKYIIKRREKHAQPRIIITDMEEEELLSYLNYDVEIVSSEEYDR